MIGCRTLAVAGEVVEGRVGTKPKPFYERLSKYILHVQYGDIVLFFLVAYKPSQRPAGGSGSCEQNEVRTRSFEDWTKNLLKAMPLPQLLQY